MGKNEGFWQKKIEKRKKVRILVENTPVWIIVSKDGVGGSIPLGRTSFFKGLEGVFGYIRLKSFPFLGVTMGAKCGSNG